MDRGCFRGLAVRVVALWCVAWTRTVKELGDGHCQKIHGTCLHVMTTFKMFYESTEEKKISEIIVHVIFMYTGTYEKLTITFII